MRRNLRDVAENYRTVETVLEEIDYDELEEPTLRGLYEDLTTRHKLVDEWREDDSVDWLVVDKFLERTEDIARNLRNAYGED